MGKAKRENSASQLSPVQNVVIIGAGKISYSIASVLSVAGYSISAIISRNKVSAKKLAKKNGVKAYSDSVSDIPGPANFFVLCVPDSQIRIAAENLSKLKLDFNKCIFIHLSGIKTIAELEALHKRGGRTASLHIMQTFPSKKPVDIFGCYAAVETEDNATRRKLFKLAKTIKLIPFSIDSDSKAEYHLAGVYASNFLTGNFFIAEKFFSSASGIGHYQKVINPIIASTLNNIKNNGAVNSLSGPVERGDIETIISHLAAFDNLIRKNKDKAGLKQIKLNYIHQSLSLLELVKGRDKKLSKKHLDIKKMLLRQIRD